MSTQRQQDSAECQARAALAALKGLQTVHELASTSGGQPPQSAHGNQRLHKAMPDIFSAQRAQRAQDHEAFQAQRSQHIGPLKVAWDWRKKQAGLAP